VPALERVQGAEPPLDVSIYEYSFQFFHSILHLCVEKPYRTATGVKNDSRPMRAGGLLNIQKS